MCAPHISYQQNSNRSSNSNNNTYVPDFKQKKFNSLCKRSVPLSLLYTLFIHILPVSIQQWAECDAHTWINKYVVQYVTYVYFIRMNDSHCIESLWPTTNRSNTDKHGHRATINTVMCVCVCLCVSHSSYSELMYCGIREAIENRVERTQYLSVA